MVHSTAKNKKKLSREESKKRVYKGKGRQKAVKEVVFDDDARREYLTGFSKRKTAKKEAAKARAVEKERLTRLDLRQQLREARKQQAASNVEMEKQFYGDEGPLDADETFEGIETDPEPQEEEYEGDELVSRVVVEEFRLSDDDDPSPDGDETLDLDGPNANMFAAIAPARIKRVKEREAAAKAKPGIATKNDSLAKKPAKRFTYETKAARKAEAVKQKARRMEKAESARSRSGGKTGRGAKASGKKRGGKR